MANPKKTPYDEHIINALAGSAYARLNDYPDAEKAFEAQVNDGFTRPADLPVSSRPWRNSTTNSKAMLGSPSSALVR